MTFKKRDDLSGTRFGRLIAISIHSVVNGKSKWNCVCDCGKSSTPYAHGLKSGNTTSCGCKTLENSVARSITHGMHKTSTYRCWQNIKTRCTLKTSKYYKNYGGRGITVCDRWATFENFLVDMGEKPAGKSIDRKDNDKGYSPDNCFWATNTEQCRNRRVTLRFEGKPLSQIAEETGFIYGTLYSRLKKFGNPFPDHGIRRLRSPVIHCFHWC